MATKMILGMYPTLEDGYQVIDKLMENGLSHQQINIIAADSAKKYFTEVTQPRDEGGRTLAGVAAGAAVGGIAGAVVGLSAVAIPGIGPLVLGGSLYGLFLGMTTGSVSGGLIGALVNWGLIDNQAKEYAKYIENGGTLLAIQAEEADINRISALMNQNHISQPPKVIDWREFKTASSSQATPVNAEVKLDTPTKLGENLLGKDESPLQAKMPGMPTIQALMPAFQEHYQKTLKNTGKPFDYYLLAYEYGYELANDDRYRRQAWEQVEPELRALWEQNDPGKWDNLQEAVHFGRDKTLQRV